MKKAACHVTLTACAVTATQVEEQFAAGLSVSPNPSKGLVRITAKRFDYELQWFDSMGRALGESKNFSDFDLSAWGSGVRYVTVTTKMMEHHVAWSFSDRQRNQVSWLRFTLVLKAPNMTVMWSPFTSRTSPRS